MIHADDVNRKPEDANYTVDILTRCSVIKDTVGKKTIKIVQLKNPGEPAVVSIPISQACLMLILHEVLSCIVAVLVVIFLVLDLEVDALFAKRPAQMKKLRVSCSRKIPSKDHCN